MFYRKNLKKNLTVLGMLSSGLFASSESGAQSAASWSQARELVTFSKKQYQKPSSSSKKEKSFFFAESSPGESSREDADQPLINPSSADLQKAEEILAAAQKPAFKAAATFVDKLTRPRCQAPPLADLMGEESDFGRAREHPPLLVFVTLSLSDDVLKTLYREASKIGGRLVIRGLVEGSFPKTRERLIALKIGAEIDPPAFEAFKVKRVPTFVYVGQGARDTNKTPPHDRLQGNVSLSYALEQFEKSGEIPGAENLLERLGSS